MEFNDENLTKEDIERALTMMKQAIEAYKKNFANTSFLYKMQENETNIRISVPESYVKHLLGFDINIASTWWEYIGDKRKRGLEWVEQLYTSRDFISYMILKNNKDALVRFSKIEFKSREIKNFNLLQDPAFFFNYKKVLHLGTINSDKILSFKLKRINPYNAKGTIKYAPWSFYVYDKGDLDSGFKIINPRIPLGVIAVNGKNTNDNNELYSEENVQELRGKIKVFTK